MYVQGVHKGRTVSRRRILNNNLSKNDILEVCDSKNENENFMEIEINESYECPSFSAEKRKNYSSTSLQGLVNKDYISAKTYEDRPVQYNSSIQTYEKNEKSYFPVEDYTNFESTKNGNFGYDNISFKNDLKDVEKDKDKDKDKGRGKGRERQREKEKGRDKDVDNVKVKIKENRNKDSYNKNTIIENLNKNLHENLNTDTTKIINKNDNNTPNNNTTNNDDINSTENHTKEHPRDITKLLGKMRKNKRRMSFPRQSSTESLETKNLNRQKDDGVSSSNKDLTENRGRRAASEAGVGVGGGMGLGLGVGGGTGVGRESGTGTGTGTGGGAGSGSKTSISPSRAKSILWTSELDSRFVITTFVLFFVILSSFIILTELSVLL